MAWNWYSQNRLQKGLVEPKLLSALGFQLPNAAVNEPQTEHSRQGPCGASRLHFFGEGGVSKHCVSLLTSQNPVWQKGLPNEVTIAILNKPDSANRTKRTTNRLGAMCSNCLYWNGSLACTKESIGSKSAGIRKLNNLNSDTPSVLRSW